MDTHLVVSGASHTPWMAVTFPTQRGPRDSAFWGRTDDPEVRRVCIIEFCIQKGPQK